MLKSTYLYRQDNKGLMTVKGRGWKFLRRRKKYKEFDNDIGNLMSNNQIRSRHPNTQKKSKRWFEIDLSDIIVGTSF